MCIELNYKLLYFLYTCKHDEKTSSVFFDWIVDIRLIPPNTGTAAGRSVFSRNSTSVFD